MTSRNPVARAALFGVMILTAWACRVDRTFECAGPDECLRGGVQGECLLPGFCAFGAGDCPSGRRWDSTAGDGLAGSCVDETGGDPDQFNACGGRAVLGAELGDPCGLCETGILACDGEDALACEGEVDLQQVATAESAGASSVFDNDLAMFGPSLAIDGDLTTSWFSDGPEGAGMPSTYSWNGLVEECIGRIQIDGNGQHANSLYRTNYGFGQVTVKVINSFGETVFTREMSLPGTPDPTLDVPVGVRGIDVELEFSGHESPECGGFSEIVVTAVR